MPPGLAKKILDLDVFASGSFGSPNFIFFNDGRGNFSPRDAPGGGSGGPRSIALGDLDGDGDLDVFVALPNQDTQVLVNDGTGNFTQTGIADGSRYSGDVALGDLNGDGHLDAFVANFGQANQLLINDGYGNFLAEDAVGGDRNSFEVALGDLNGDVHLDVFVANFYQADQILFSDGIDGNFTATDAPGALIGAGSVALGDLDGDGDLDVFRDAYNPVGYAAQVLLNDGDGNFSAVDTGILGFYDTDIALGDLDGDGDLDVFVARSDSYSNNTILFNDGDGINFTAVAAPTTGYYGSFTEAVAVGDLDGDGDLDVFATGIYNDVLTNDGDGNFTATAVDAGGNLPFDAALGDLDGDGGIPAVNDAGLPNLDTNDLLPSMYADTVIA